MQTKNGTIFNKILKIIILLVIIAAVYESATNFSNANKETKEKEEYYTGEILKPNHSANLLDYIDDSSNILISPININTSINKLYNINEDNNSIKLYLNKTLEESNKLEKEYNNSLQITELDKTKIDDLYINLMNELNNYKDYTVNDIKNIDKKEKVKLKLLLHKIKLSYESITKIKDNTEKYINNYTLTTEETNINDHAIYEMIIDSFDKYETYNYKNKINNYNEVIYNDDLLIKTKNKKKQKYPTINNVTLTGISYSDTKITTQTINNKIKENTNNNIKYIIEKDTYQESELIMINTFNFESLWEDNFEKQYITDSEFTTYDEQIEIVESLYENTNYYLENKQAIGFIKNFKDNKYSFVGILPKEKGNFKLSALNIESLLKNKKEEVTSISIPKFNYQYNLDLNKIYNQIGIENINNEIIELDNLNNGVTLNNIYSKVSINIDEKGTNKSQIRSTYQETKELEETTNHIYLNRPFAFMIIDNETNNVLLMGKVNNPNQK